jgi:hypothetical protein
MYSMGRDTLSGHFGIPPNYAYAEWHHRTTSLVCMPPSNNAKRMLMSESMVMWQLMIGHSWINGKSFTRESGFSLGDRNV